MTDVLVLDGRLAALAIPQSLLGLRWAVDPLFAADWVQSRGGALDTAAAAQRRAPLVAAASRGVAVIPVYGVLTQRAGMCSLGCDEVSLALRQAMADPQVGGVLLDIDSPGGSTFGVDELAAEVMAARAVKPIRAIGNSRMDSAAYWLASAASEISVTPGGEAGSIGVYMVHQAGEEPGVSVISAGRYKVEASPYAPLSDEARSALQARVDHDYGRFVARVALGRGVPEARVRERYGEGRALPAELALQEGLVDRVETFDQALARLAGDVASGVPAGVVRAEDQPDEAERLAQVRRMQLDLEHSYLGGRRS